MIYIVVNGNYIAYDDIIRRIWHGLMVTDAKWQERAKRLLKAEIARKGVGYKELAEKLKEIGVKDTAENIANKISRGGFSAVFLLQCLQAIGCTSVDLRGTGD